MGGHHEQKNIWIFTCSDSLPQHTALSFQLLPDVVLSHSDSSLYTLYLKHVAFFIRNIRQIGAVAPSSAYLTERMVEPLRKRIQDSKTGPLRILEVGPGTGAITRHIVPLLRKGDHVDVVELNPILHAHVAKEYAAEGMHFHNMNLLDVEANEPYDFIFSGIPYESLPVNVTEMLWRKKLQLSKEGTIITYFKYLNIIQIRSPFLRNLIASCCKHQGMEFRNLPPARYYHLTISESILKEFST
jgi:phosphatidylethanolamine/phosphatidyl-N-methylethanolamine N-methyltransferase